jgi:hypothetical protein
MKKWVFSLYFCTMSITSKDRQRKKSKQTSALLDAFTHLCICVHRQWCVRVHSPCGCVKKTSLRGTNFLPEGFKWKEVIKLNLLPFFAVCLDFFERTMNANERCVQERICSRSRFPKLIFFLLNFFWVRWSQCLICLCPFLSCKRHLTILI